MNKYSVGSLVNFRGREWLILPSPDEELLNLRPLTGSEADSCGVFLPLEGNKIEAASFPMPKLKDIGDFEAARLLGNAARLLIRDGAGPFRSFGHLSFRPRPYQLVPLLMALRLETVRMVIADDVGVGKTIEAALIARELLDRGEIKRFAVVCPPGQLCDQWQDELQKKFNLDAKIIRSDTISRLERELPRQDLSVFSYYPFIVVSVDFAKTERHRAQFIQHCPDLIIVDEAHGCAKPAGVSTAQQQRHHLISDLSKKASQHILLVTATPHSGIEESFLSLLGFIKPAFAQIDLDSPKSESRAELARHLIQRRRSDVEQWMGAETQFPERDPKELPFKLSPEYEKLFQDIYKFAGELVSSDEDGSSLKRRVRYWTALALLRCVMSSPDAAIAALKERMKKVAPESEADEEAISSSVMDPTDSEKASDVLPTHAVDHGAQTFSDSEKRRLRDFEKRAELLKEGKADMKIEEASREISTLIKDGFKPIVFCRFIETANYVAAQLRDRLSKEVSGLQIMCITGEDPDEERKNKVKELCQFPKRLLVATDCLSEGINLQDGFDAVLHYDLPWNPNRLDQREGRVDRFGQKNKHVRTVLLYGSNNLIDGIVLDVLIRKAREIHTKLGVMVPLPVSSETIMESVLKALFFRGAGGLQLGLFNLNSVTGAYADAHKKWEVAVEREKKSRSTFAQYALKPEEIAPELEATDSVLGNSAFVKRFVMNTIQRLGGQLSENSQGILSLGIDSLNPSVKARLKLENRVKIAFEQPEPEGTLFVSRNHPLVSTLAEYVFDSAFSPSGDRSLGARCGVVKCRNVNQRTVLILLRPRFAIKETETGETSLVEECLLTGFVLEGNIPKWLDKDEAEKILTATTPSANLTEEQKAAEVAAAFKLFPVLAQPVESKVKTRARDLLASYERLRRTIKGKKFTVEPLLPVDIMSITVFLPG